MLPNILKEISNHRYFVAYLLIKSLRHRRLPLQLLALVRDAALVFENEVLMDS